MLVTLSRDLLVECMMGFRDNGIITVTFTPQSHSAACLQEEKLSVEGAGVAGLAAILPGGPLHEVRSG